MSGTGLALIAEARRLGLAIRAEGDTIKVKPADRLPADLAERIKANRAEVLAVLLSTNPDGSTADAPRSTESDANRPDGVQGGGNAPEGKPKGFDAMLYLAELQAKDTPIPAKWQLDDLDRRVLLQLGILPTPGPDELPPAWKVEYDRIAARLVKRIGLPREHAEAIALKNVLERMYAAGELTPEGW